MNHIEGKKILYSWKPDKNKAENQKAPDEYIVCRCITSQIGIVVYARNGEIYRINPMQKNYLIKHLMLQVLSQRS